MSVLYKIVEKTTWNEIAPPVRTASFNPSFLKSIAPLTSIFVYEKDRLLLVYFDVGPSPIKSE